MECISSKSMAEFMLERNDFSGAMKFALKAQRLYPEVEGISKMLSMIQVYLSAERKVGGEVDWYGVLRVGPTANDETITKHYKRLALEMHPDKNIIMPFGHNNFEAGSSSGTPPEQPGPNNFRPGVFEAQQRDPPPGRELPLVRSRTRF